MPAPTCSAASPRLTLVDIADSQAHLALAYVATVSDNGHTLRRQEFRDYMANPQRIRTHSTSLSLMSAAFSRQLADLAKLYGGTTTNEALLDYLCRVHWLVVDSDHVAITPLGRAVLRSLERQAIDDETPVDVVLDDELSYARMIGTIAEAGPAALVEPYFSLEQLLPIVQQTEIERVLTHPDKKSGKGRIAALATGLAGVSLDRPFEIRSSDAMHDRFLISKTGPVRTIGSSLNHLGRRFSVSLEIRDDHFADAIRHAFEQAWSAATPVEPPALPAPPAETPKPRARKSGSPAGASKRAPRKKQPAASSKRKPSSK